MRTKKQKQASRKNFALCRVIGMRTNLKQIYNQNEKINNLIRLISYNLTILSNMIYDSKIEDWDE